MFLSDCFVSVLWVFCSYCVIYTPYLGSCLRVWAGLPHFDSTACGHHFGCCRLHVCVSVPGRHSNSPTCLIATEWFSLFCLCAEIQWGCLSLDILASTGHLCKWIKSTGLSLMYINWWFRVRITVLSLCSVVYFIVYCILICCKEPR